MSSAITLALTVSGQIGKVPIEPFQASYALSGQEMATGPKEVTVSAGTSPGGYSVAVEPMSEQTLLLICSDKGITYQLNSDGINRTVGENAFAIHPGDPVVQQLAFGNAGTTDAGVTIFQLGVQGTPPSGIGGAIANTDEITATVTQTDFTLSAEPADPTKVLVFRDGALQSFSDYTVSGTTLTWTGTPYAGGERVQIVF